MHKTKLLLLAVSFGSALVLATTTFAKDEPSKTGKPEAGEPAKAAKCEHGVKKTICTRCNPKLEAVFKAKGDWCAEHKRAESQCAICNPKLEKEGVKK